ncbi:hypothetical protein [Paraburkholderia jirisanensis]
MSTTIPFTLIEGAMALPSTRPLGPVSRTFGREWALLPPNVSLRIELKALYTAVLRTFCLSSQAMRSMCKWDRQPATAEAQQLHAPAVQTTEPAAAVASAASVAFTVAATSATAGAAGVAAGVAAAGASPGSGATRPTRAPLTSHRKSNFPLGSAFAIGGAALLAWIVLDHPQRHPPAQPVAAPVKPVAPVVTSPVLNAPRTAVAAEQLVSDVKPVTEAGASESVAASAGVAASASASASALHDAQPAALTAQAGSSALNVAASHPLAPAPADPQSASSNDANTTSRPTPVSSTRVVAHVVTPNTSATSAREVAHYPARRHNPAHATTRNAVPQPSAAVYTASPVARPSAAGDYSPVQPSALGASEYASVHTFARTDGADHTRHADRTLPQRSASGADSSVETSWMSHMSQRRVTEVPEQFSQ